jgi:hypothetical protein
VFRRRCDFVEYETIIRIDPSDDFYLSSANAMARLSLIEDVERLDSAAKAQLELERLAESVCFGNPLPMHGGSARIIGWQPELEEHISSRDLGAAIWRASESIPDVVDAIGSLPKTRLADETALRFAPTSEREKPGLPASEWHFEDPHFSELGVGRMVTVTGAIPVTVEADIVVAGAGTSGFPAALEAATDGSRVVCFDARAETGGTNTIGGVAKYWFGNWTKYFKTQLEALMEYESKNHLPRSAAQMRMLLDAGVEFMPLAPLSGVAGSPAGLEAVCVASSTGLRGIKGKVYIDATGDGDVAAWLGCPYSYGAGRDEISLWYSFGKFHGGKPEASRLFNAVVDQRSLADATRAMVIGRRQVGNFGEAEYPVFYLAPRESRHITGKVVLSYIDMLVNRAYVDTVLTCRSNIDIKGLTGSDAAFIGLVEDVFLGNYSMRVPYRALLPVDGPDNLIVTGKAYSISHDGLSMARMVPDMIGLGAVAGVAASIAGRDFSSVSIQRLQAKLLERGIVTECEIAADPVDGFGRPDQPIEDAELRLLVERFSVSPTDLTVKAAILSSGERAIPPLRPLIQHTNPTIARTAARFLCYLGCSDGVELLLSYLEEAFSKSETFRFGYWRHKMPDHGIAPEPARTVYALALVAEPRLIPLISKMLQKLALRERPTDGTYNYLHATSYALERVAEADGADSLRRVLSDDALSGASVFIDDDPRLGADINRERYAYLRLCFARALARCGQKDGYSELIAMLSEQRIYISRAALAELEELSGESFGWSSEEWCDWLASVSKLKAAPYTRRHV